MPIGQGSRNTTNLGGLGRPNLFDTNIKATSIDEDIFTDQEVISSAEDADLVLVLDVSETPDQIKYMTKSNFIGEGLVAVANNTNNYVATMTGAALNGEANLTFDGTILTNEGGEVDIDISSGDPHLSFQIGSSDKWTIGADDSDSDKFKINSAGSLVDASDLILDSSGNLTLKGGITVGDSVSAMNSSGLVQVAGQTSITSLGTLTGLTLDGNKSVTPGDGAMIHLDTSTITDSNTSGSGTATKYTHVTFEAPTLAATNSSVTTTSAATVYINAAPSAGTNQTLTNAYALWVDAGTAKLDGDVHVGGDLTVAGDDITMGTNTAGHVLVADDTNFNPVAVSGDVTMASTGAVTIANDAVESGMLNDNVISGQTEISSGLVDADELLYSDGGVLKKVGLDTLKSAIQSGIEGDITGVTLTADDTNTASDTSGSADFTLAGGANITTSVSGSTVTSALDSSPTLTSSSANQPVLTVTNTHADATGGIIKFNKDPGSGQGADSDVMGTITWYGTDASNNAPEELARMEAYVIEADHGSEAGGIKFYVAENDATMTAGLQVLGVKDADGEIDVTIGAGAASTTTIAGTLTMGSTAAMTNAGLLSVANQTGITGVGTISSGVWQGTAIASGYIANDAIDSQHYADGSIDNAHIADDAIDSEHYADGSIDNAHIADDQIDSEHYADGSIDTAHIADDQVTLAKMAGLTRGSLIIGDASGDPSALAKGTENYVLTSDGTDIAWAAASTSSAFTSSSANNPVVSITNTHADATAGFLKFVKDPGSGQGADSDILGTITFHGTDASNNAIEELARMEAYVIEADHGSEAGGIKFYVAENDATMTAGLQILGVKDADGEIDVTIGAGAASTTIIAGTLTMGSTAAMTNAGLLSVGAQTGITNVANVVEVGALDAGSITSGFTSIDVGAGGITTTGAIAGGTIDASTDFTIGTTVITDDSIVMTPSTSDTVTVAAATNGVLNITTVDNAAAAANLNFVVDGAVDVDSAGAINLDSGSGIWTFEDSGTEVLRFTESGSGDVTVKLETNAKDLIFTDNGDAEGFRILDGAAGVRVASGLDVAAAAVSPVDTAHNAAGTAISLAAGNTTAGTTNNIAGGALTIKGGRGKGSGAGGDIIFQTANAGGSGSSLNSLATALTISDDLSSTFADNVFLGSDSAVLNMGADNDVTLTHDGTTGLTIAANPFEVDSGGNITLDAHTGVFIFQDANTEVLRFTESGSGDVTIKLAVNGKDLIFTDNGDAAGLTIKDAQGGIVVPGEVMTTKISYTDGDDAITVADGGGTTFAKDVTLADDAELILADEGQVVFGDAVPSTDHTATGVVVKMNAKTGLALGEAVYIDSDGDLDEADADAASTMPAIGVALEANGTGSDAVVKILIMGVLRDDTYNFTPGADLYIGTTAGEITATAPSGSGDTVQKIGVALSADSIYVNFNTAEVLLA